MSVYPGARRITGNPHFEANKLSASPWPTTRPHRAFDELQPTVSGCLMSAKCTARNEESGDKKPEGHDS